MRPRFRALLASMSLAALALPVLAGGALAAGNGVASPYVVDDTWCWPNEAAPSYCFVMNGRFEFVENRAVSVATGTIRQYTAAYEDGELASESYRHTVDQWRTDVDGDAAIVSIEHSRFVSGSESCTATTVLRIADYEVKVDHWQVSCH